MAITHSTEHPTDEQLRWLADDTRAVPGEVQEHVESCAQCIERLRVIEDEGE